MGIVVWQLANLVETPEILAQSPLRLYDYNFISLFIYLFFFASFIKLYGGPLNYVFFFYPTRNQPVMRTQLTAFHEDNPISYGLDTLDSTWMKGNITTLVIILQFNGQSTFNQMLFSEGGWIISNSNFLSSSLRWLQYTLSSMKLKKIFFYNTRNAESFFVFKKNIPKLQRVSLIVKILKG